MKVYPFWKLALKGVPLLTGLALLCVSGPLAQRLTKDLE